MKGMLQKRIAVILSLLVMVSLAGCSGSGTSESTTSQDDQTAAEEGVSSQGFDYDAALSTMDAYTEGATLDTSPVDVQIHNYVGASDDMLVGTVDDEPVLAYYDFDLEQWIPFCSNSSCSHDSESCNAWLGSGGYGGFMQEGDFIYYFAAENNYKNLYLMRFDIQSQQYSKVCELTFDVDVLIIDTMSTGYYIDGEVYFIQSMWAEDGDSSITCYYLMEMELDTGEVKHCIELPQGGMGFYGVYDNKVLLSSNEFTDDDVLTEDEYYEIYGGEGDYYEYTLDKENNIVFMTLDLDTEEYTTIASFDALSEVDYPVPWDMYGSYFFYAKENTVYACSIETGEAQILFSGTKDNVYIESVIDDCIFYIDTSQEEAMHCVYNLKTGLGYELGTYDYEGNPYSSILLSFYSS